MAQIDTDSGISEHSRIIILLATVFSLSLPKQDCCWQCTYPRGATETSACSLFLRMAAQRGLAGGGRARTGARTTARDRLGISNREQGTAAGTAGGRSRNKQQRRQRQQTTAGAGIGQDLINILTASAAAVIH